MLVIFRTLAVSLVAALETKSSHPLAVAIVNLYSGCITNKIAELGSQIGLSEVNKFKNESGMGLSGEVEEHFVLVGNLKLVQHYNIIVIEEYIQHYNTWSKNGYTVIFAAIDNKVGLVWCLLFSFIFGCRFHRCLCLYLSDMVF